MTCLYSLSSSVDFRDVNTFYTQRYLTDWNVCWVEVDVSCCTLRAKTPQEVSGGGTVSELTLDLTYWGRSLWGNVKQFTIGSLNPGVSCKQRCQIAKVLCEITYCISDTELRLQFSSYAKFSDMNSSCLTSLKTLFWQQDRLRLSLKVKGLQNFY